MPFAIHYGNNVWAVGRTKNAAKKRAVAAIDIYNSLAPSLGLNRKANPKLKVTEVSRFVAREIRERGGLGVVPKYKLNK
jgi:hypothetical protein